MIRMCMPDFLKIYSSSALFDAVEVLPAFNNKLLDNLLKIFIKRWNEPRLEEILSVIVRSTAMASGTAEREMRMLRLASRRTKEEMQERISTPTPGLPGSRIYSLSSPGYDHGPFKGRLQKSDFHQFVCKQWGLSRFTS